MGPPERRARQKQALRQRILDAARELFVEEGYDRVSMRRIAQRIEYSATAIYLHFEDKEALFQALCDETFERLGKRLEALERRVDDPLERLRAGLQLYIEFGLSHPQHYTVTFLLKSEGHAKPFAESAGARAFTHLRTGVSHAIAAGQLSDGDVEAIAQSLWAACHGVVSLLIGMDRKKFPFVSRRVLAAHTVDTMLRGLR
jgi:AcrR family transcriptional regulator